MTLLPLHKLAHDSQSLYLKLIGPETPKHFFLLILFYLTFDPCYQGLITSNFNPITLFWDANIAVNIIQITHAELNDPGLINNYNTVSNQSSANGKKNFGIANVKNNRFIAHLSPLNDW